MLKTSATPHIKSQSTYSYQLSIDKITYLTFSYYSDCARKDKCVLQKDRCRIEKGYDVNWRSMERGERSLEELGGNVRKGESIEHPGKK